ncbi:MAG TPA: DUF4173 domain-containing protein [Pyrinomonadaceae bacterium]|nr:DUF4173 domain-containing protein [Pyrinomonadaceae bacterium]
MTERTKLGLGVAEAALLLGVLGDALLRATPWGVNVTLWVGAFLAATLALGRHKGVARAPSREARWLWGAVMLLAVFFAWRDSLTLRVLDTLMILGALSLAALTTRAGRVRAAGVSEYALAVLTSAANALFGFFPLLFADVSWRELPRSGWTRHLWAVARGVLLAAPLVLLFGALFVAADAVYESLVQETLAFDAELTASHVFLVFFVTWLVGGYLRGALLARAPFTDFARFKAHNPLGLNLNETKPASASPPANTSAKAQTSGAAETQDPSELRGLFSGGEAGKTDSASDATGKSGTVDAQAHTSTMSSTASTAPPSSSTATSSSSQTSTSSPASTSATKSETPRKQLVSLGLVEVGIVLGLLDVLFLSFVVVQLRYFFGDSAHVVNSAGLTFSDYARRGFFELVWVALLALPVLLAAHWLLRKDEAGLGERVFRMLAGAMLGLLFVIMASALWRMRLYQVAYGQTELRFYTTAFMFWLGAVFVWFAATVLRGRRERFAWGAAVAGFLTLVALHVANPTEQIVRANLARAQMTGRFDAAYAVSLGDDAVPALVAALPSLNPRDRNYVAHRLVQHERTHAAHDWRSWNLGRARAGRVVRVNGNVLSDWAREWEVEMRGAATLNNVRGH